MPKFRYTGKAPIRIGNAEYRLGDVYEADANPEPNNFEEILPIAEQAQAEEPPQGRRKLTVSKEGDDHGR
jgi:hypothetical protein